MHLAIWMTFDPICSVEMVNEECVFLSTASNGGISFFFNFFLVGTT